MRTKTRIIVFLAVLVALGLAANGLGFDSLNEFNLGALVPNNQEENGEKNDYEEKISKDEEMAKKERKDEKAPKEEKSAKENDEEKEDVEENKENDKAKTSREKGAGPGSKEIEKEPEGNEDGFHYEDKWDREDLIHKLEHFISPIEGAEITRRESQLPGAPREYRDGIHQGVDYYNDFVGVPIEMDTPVLAVADGTVIRADHGYEELSRDYREEILHEAMRVAGTPEDILDGLRGKQVEIKHEDGIVTRYAHLNSIPEDIEEGVEVEKGQEIGGVGNTGTSDGVEGTYGGAHLHFEIWLNEDIYLGKGMEPTEARDILVEIFD